MTKDKELLEKVEKLRGKLFEVSENEINQEKLLNMSQKLDEAINLVMKKK